MRAHEADILGIQGTVHQLRNQSIEAMLINVALPGIVSAQRRVSDRLACMLLAQSLRFARPLARSSTLSLPTF